MNLFKKAVYLLLENSIFRHGVLRCINGRQVRFPVAVSRYFPKTYEMEKFDFLCNHISPGDTVIDIGAHIGLFSVFMAQMVGERGRVFAFEPSGTNFEILGRTISLNSLYGVIQASNRAIDERSGEKNLYVTGDFASNANSLMSQTAIETFETIHATNLDAEEFSNIDVSAIKIDAEGSEVAIFRGGRSFFARNRPYCTMEIHPELIKVNGDRVEDLIDMVMELGYDFYIDGNEVDATVILAKVQCFEVQLLPRP